MHDQLAINLLAYDLNYNLDNVRFSDITAYDPRTGIIHLEKPDVQSFLHEKGHEVSLPKGNLGTIIGKLTYPIQEIIAESYVINKMGFRNYLNYVKNQFA